MKDQKDKSTPDMIGELPRGRGRPATHVTAEEKRAAAAEASKRYRDKQRALRDARKKPENKLTSDVIDLSAIDRW